MLHVKIKAPATPKKTTTTTERRFLTAKVKTVNGGGKPQSGAWPSVDDAALLSPFRHRGGSQPEVEAPLSTSSAVGSLGGAAAALVRLRTHAPLPINEPIVIPTGVPFLQGNSFTDIYPLSAPRIKDGQQPSYPTLYGREKRSQASNGRVKNRNDPRPPADHETRDYRRRRRGNVEPTVEGRADCIAMPGCAVRCPNRQDCLIRWRRRVVRCL
ncbi:hypothetical protein AAFF_G00166990 [Aldrovandia affinis]|uniref:Uncharacterized protein n=1 Tax=Aldrovandia affinis TaxID=143900 RepID=A0AAD7RMH2_9TELE|nr:hypothetical protein AAFF_G00166990 [Aldrovandia affinis]